MQSMSGVPAAALCSVVHWFALSALAATPCLYPSVRQSRVKSGQVRAKSGSTTTTTLLLLLYLPTYILDISPTALRCTPSGLTGQVQEIDGDLEVAGVVAVMGRNAAIHEAEVEVTAENATVVAVGEVTVAAIREVVALLAIVMRLSARVTGVARDDLPAAAKNHVCILRDLQQRIVCAPIRIPFESPLSWRQIIRVFVICE
ncbi:hypothetical protein EAG_02353 [Camponotus floridanus]|uniref:Secreted protein n=1 Tax=Camponotus floridanus TaxID=104421 RepID=E2AR54_CAMFO|nr:hypothetical protein EAG_02353 [Camponotus floridanus]